MQGIIVFSTLEEAIRAGFSVYDRVQGGYIVRMSTPGGFALALVTAKP